MRNVRLITMALPLSLSLAACGSTGQGSEDQGTSGDVDSVTVATAPVADYAPLYLGVEKGFFEKEGLSVDFASGRVGTETIASVLSGATDFAGVALPPLLVSQSQNLGVSIVTPSSVAPAEKQESSVQLLVKDDISSLKELQGKTVAVNALKAQLELMVQWYLETENVNADEITFVEVPFSEMPAALQRGDVDAIAAVEPFLSSALEDGARSIAEVDRALPDGAPVTAFFTSDQLATSDPELVQKFSAAMTKSLDYAAEHPDEIRNVITDYAQVPAEITSDMVLPAFQSELDRDGVTQTRDAMERFGFLSSTDFDVNEMFWSRP